jgi:hypothetical protein
MTSLRLVLLTGVALLGLHAGVARAASPILIDRTIPLADGVTDRLPECPWATELATGIARQADGLVKLSDTPLADGPTRTLKIRATHVHVPGGGNFSGPKWIRLVGELRLDGKLLDTFEMRRTSGSGWPRNACSTARMVAKPLMSDVARWARAHADTMEPVAGVVAPSLEVAEPEAQETAPAAEPATESN